MSGVMNGHSFANMGEALMAHGLIAPAQFQAALAWRQTNGGSMGRAVAELNLVRQDEVSMFLVRQCKAPLLDVRDFSIKHQLLDWVPEEVCLAHDVLPLDKIGNTLSVAMVDPMDMQILMHIRRGCRNMQIRPVVCYWDHFKAVAAKLFPKSRFAAGQKK